MTFYAPVPLGDKGEKDWVFGVFPYGFVFQKDIYDLLCPVADGDSFYALLKNVPPTLRQCEQYIYIYIYTHKIEVITHETDSRF